MDADGAPDRRDNWWHVVVATPLSTLAVGLIGGWLGTLLFLPFWLLWPVACWRDGAYVRASTDSSTPSRRSISEPPPRVFHPRVPATSRTMGGAVEA